MAGNVCVEGGCMAGGHTWKGVVHAGQTATEVGGHVETPLHPSPTE